MARALQLLSSCAAWGGAVAAPPHIVFTLIDDLGFAGVGFNSPTGEPHTPTIDALAAEGAVLGRHYTYQFCSPTRSSFLSGRLPIHVNQQNHPPCELGGGVPAEMTTLATVLRGAGYSTHHAGKWHGGMSHTDRLPVNRGFDSSLAMLSGAADHFTNKRACGGGNYVDLWKNDAPAYGIDGTYSEFSYVAHMVEVINQHDASKPLFLYMAFQNVHGPTEAPARFFDLYDSSIYKKRLNGLAQVSAVDEGIANITSALKAKDMWSNTLYIFSSDNGGPGDHENNYPLRGTKGSDFEGGVRVVAFVAGGWLPNKLRGKSIGGMMHVADWYATFAALAGVDPMDASAANAGLPPIDSLDMSHMISGTNATSPRTELVLSYPSHDAGEIPSGNRALISGKYKLVLNGKPIKNGFFPGVTTPNGTDYTSNLDCSKGCLFDLEADELEHFDLAAQMPDVVATLTARLNEVGQTVYQSPSAGPQKDAVTMAKIYKGYWGPWEGLVPTPSPSPAPGGSFHLARSDGTTCLRATSLSKASALAAGVCDGKAEWLEDDDGFVYNAKGEDDHYKFVRQSGKYPACVAGGGTRLGTLTKHGIGAKLNGSLLVLQTCDDMCVGKDASVTPCADEAAGGWQKQAARLV